MTTHEWVEKLKGEGVRIDFKKSIYGSKDGEDEGAYYWTSDRIELTLSAGICTVFHELSHWTGNSSRLNRKAFNVWQGDDWIREELIAWESTQTVANKLGIGLDVESHRLFAVGKRERPHLIYKKEALEASSYLIHRFGL